MKNVPIPAINSQIILDEIIASKRLHNTILKTMRADLLTLYRNYEDNVHKLELLTAFVGFNKDCIEAIQHCYNVNTKPLEALRSVIHTSLGDIGRCYCPYCLISEPRTIDHYMPKELFPEFSILPINLISCCSDCNNLRNTAWVKASNRTTINAYFDTLENKRFLYAETYFESNIPQIKFIIQNNEGISEYIFKIITNHFDLLQLQHRYRNQVGNVISEIHTRFSKPMHRSMTQVQKKSLLIEEANSHRDTNGANYWKAAVLEALSNSEQFLSSISTN